MQGVRIVRTDGHISIKLACGLQVEEGAIVMESGPLTPQEAIRIGIALQSASLDASDWILERAVTGK